MLNFLWCLGQAGRLAPEVCASHSGTSYKVASSVNGPPVMPLGFQSKM